MAVARPIPDVPPMMTTFLPVSADASTIAMRNPPYSFLLCWLLVDSLHRTRIIPDVISSAYNGVSFTMTMRPQTAYRLRHRTNRYLRSALAVAAAAALLGACSSNWVQISPEGQRVSVVTA